MTISECCVSNYTRLHISIKRKLWKVHAAYPARQSPDIRRLLVTVASANKLDIYILANGCHNIILGQGDSVYALSRLELVLPVENLTDSPQTCGD